MSGVKILRREAHRTAGEEQNSAKGQGRSIVA
jgi:hypothetical protein